MSDLISRSALLKYFCVNKDGRRIPEFDCDNIQVTVSIKDVKQIIREQPAVEAVPVVRGEWTLAFTEEENVWKCSVCDRYWLLNNGTPFDNEMNFCPKCGADMRKKVE